MLYDDHPSTMDVSLPSAWPGRSAALLERLLWCAGSHAWRPSNSSRRVPGSGGSPCEKGRGVEFISFECQCCVALFCSYSTYTNAWNIWGHPLAACVSRNK